MMHAVPFAGPKPFFAIFHLLGGLLFWSGVLLLAFWAFKHLSAAQLKRWGLRCVIVGAAICLLAFAGFLVMRPFSSHMQMPMMDEMMDDELGSDMVDTGMMQNPMRMTMDDMVADLDGKTGDDFDRAFIEGMIPHHQGAIDMAEAALTSAKHEEIREMARAIIQAQQTEIDQMNAWGKAWGYDQ
jgi:hypothetical protein